MKGVYFCFNFWPSPPRMKPCYGLLSRLRSRETCLAWLLGHGVLFGRLQILKGILTNAPSPSEREVLSEKAKTRRGQAQYVCVRGVQNYLQEERTYLF